MKIRDTMTILLFLALTTNLYSDLHGGLSNVALNRPVLASDIYEDFYPSYAVDGNRIWNFWNGGKHGTPSDPVWLEVDLEAAHPIELIRLWGISDSGIHDGYTNDYILYSSLDDHSWIEIGRGTLAQYFDPIDEITCSGAEMRYLRFDVIGGTHWAHLCEIEVHVAVPEANNVSVCQRNDCSKLVDIHYDLLDTTDDVCNISVEISNDGGSTWSVLATSFTGDIGPGITPGTGKHIIWDCKADLPGVIGSNYQVRVIADDGN